MAFTANELKRPELIEMWGYDASKYSEARLIKDFMGVTIWEVLRRP